MENFTESEALDAYDEINSFMLQLGDVGQPKAETLEKFLKMLKRVEDSIVRESMFSENEELEDINEEFLKLLALPYVHAKLKQRVQVKRLEALKECKELFTGFTNLMKHYEVCPSFVTEHMAGFNKSKNYNMNREAKVNLYRSKKVADDEAMAKTVKYAQGSLKAIEFFKSVFVTHCYDALNEFSMLDREIEMLEYKKKLQVDPDFREKHDEKMSEPQPKPFYYKMMPDLCHKHANENIPGATMTLSEKHIQDLNTNPNLNPNLLSNPNANVNFLQDPTNPEYQFNHVQNPHSLVQTFDDPTLSRFNQRQEIMSKVFQPDHAQPNMTMAELGDIEYRLMIEKQEKMKRNEELKLKTKEMLGEDICEEMERQKQSEWDDWKDKNERGVGNKGNL